MGLDAREMAVKEERAGGIGGVKEKAANSSVGSGRLRKATLRRKLGIMHGD